MLANGVLGQTVGRLNEGFDGTDLSAYLIHTRTEYSSLYFYRILVTVQSRVDADGIFVHQFKIVEVELTDIEHGVHLPSLSVDTDGLCISIACETASITEQGGCALGLLHFVEHGTLDFSGDIHQSLIRPYGHDIIVL